MMSFQRFVVTSGLCLGSLIVYGCGNSEPSPSDPSKVPVVDPAVIEKAMNQEEAKKHLPKGAKFGSGVMPKNQPGK